MPPSVDSLTQPVKPSVLIRKEKSDPSVLTPFVMQRTALSRVFDVQVEHPGIDALTLRYYWYYDYTKSVPSLDQTVVCATAQNRCVLFPCNQADYIDDHHRLMVVVSDLPLRVTEDQNHDPFDFPTGAHFDWLQWDIELKGVCPGK